jgi:hypothetical protein
VVVRDLAKVEARVRFPHPAPNSFFLPVIQRSGSLFCSAPGPISLAATGSLFCFAVLHSCWSEVHMLAYLCGPIDVAGESGKLWRRKLAPFLREQLGHRVYDPSEDARRCLTDEELANFELWQRTDLDRFRRVVRRIISADMNLIENKVDYLICVLDDEVAQPGGTLAGLTAGHRKGIPVYLVTTLPVEKVDSWVLGCSDQVFSSIEGLKEFLTSRFAREKQTQLWKD